MATDMNIIIIFMMSMHGIIHYKKLCYLEEHSASVVLSWCTLSHL